MPPKISKQFICKVCSRAIIYKNVIQCTFCDDCYHSRCIGISSDQVYSSTVNKWTCPPCANRLGIRIVSGFSVSDSDDGAKKKASSLGSDDGDKTIAKWENMLEKQIQRFLSDLQSKFESQFEKFNCAVEDNLSDIKNEIIKISKQTPNIDNKLSDLNDRIAELEEKMKSFTPQLTEDIAE
ncbi:hypothetical protein KQX54_006009 [Cotesia glomerata]|uniref:PHD-type domain-containing protein n=1 Tax=Cotesia glomerata TaxID=32391 RepID=A0AAV7IIM9_COTGL|nr:hypothetical protein KQX54_006009 [Cotesia glomerata]